MTLNPADPRPLYHQLAGLLRQQIAQGTLVPGQQVPTEGELASLYATSRNTVRLALNALRTEGLLTSIQGRGTFVRTVPAMKYYASFTGSRRKRLEADRPRDTFAQQVEAKGKVPRQDSTVEVVPADAEIAAHLKLDTDAEVVVRRRVMFADGEPVQLGNSYYPLSIVKGTKIMDPAPVIEGTDQVLEDLGHIPNLYNDEITWRMPTSDEATTLRIQAGTPIGRVLRTTLDQNGLPIEVYLVILPGDRHVLLYELSAE